MTGALKAGYVAVSGAALVLAFALPGRAQSRGGARNSGGVSRGMSGKSRAPVARVAPRVAAPTYRSSVPRSVAPARSFRSSRLASTRAWRDHHGHPHRGRSVIILTPGYPGYYYYPYDNGYGYGYDSGYDNGYGYAPDDTTQQPIYAQQPIYPQQAEPDVVEQPAPARSQYAVASPAASLPNPGEFILVRKDGQILFTSAFTFSGDQLIYITRQGLRRAFPVAELDKDATCKMNDAAGTTLVLPG